MKIIGGVWLTLYGTNKIVKLNKLKNLNIDKNKEENIKKILITLFIITYINPHVYLDTVILIGSISSNFENKLLFGLGAIISSFTFR